MLAQCLSSVQWIVGNMTPQRVVLQAKQFRGSHAGQAGAFDDMLQTWGIPKSYDHVVLRDNTKNMIKAMNDAGHRSLWCAAHNPPLAVNKVFFGSGKCY